MRNIKLFMTACALFLTGIYFAGYRLSLEGGDLKVEAVFDNHHHQWLRVQVGDSPVTFLHFDVQNGEFVSFKEIHVRKPDIKDIWSAACRGRGPMYRKLYSLFTMTSTRVDIFDKPIIEKLVFACENNTLSDVHPMIEEGLKKLLIDLGGTDTMMTSDEDMDPVRPTKKRRTDEETAEEAYDRTMQVD